MQTKRIAEEFERQRDAADEEAFRNSPQNQQRVALLALIDQRIDQRLAELRRAADGAAVTRAREVLRRQNAEAPAPANTTRPG
jgi:hypothetical protein